MNLNVAMYIIILIALLLIVVIWIYMEMQYRNVVIVREWVNGRKRILKRKAKEHLDKHKLLWWKINKEKDPIKKIMPPPPSEAIDLTHKGRKWAECYRTEHGEVIWINDTAEVVSNVPPDLFDGIDEIYASIRNHQEREFKTNAERQRRVNEWLKENQKVMPFQPLTTNQRVALINSICNAEMRKSTTIWDTISKFGVPAIFLFMVILLLVFWGEIAAPVLEAQKEGTRQYELLLESNKIQRQIYDDVQIIKGEDDG